MNSIFLPFLAGEASPPPSDIEGDDLKYTGLFSDEDSPHPEEEPTSIEEDPKTEKKVKNKL